MRPLRTIINEFFLKGDDDDDEDNDEDDDEDDNGDDDDGDDNDGDDDDGDDDDGGEDDGDDAADQGVSQLWVRVRARTPNLWKDNSEIMQL